MNFKLTLENPGKHPAWNELADEIMDILVKDYNLESIPDNCNALLHYALSHEELAELTLKIAGSKNIIALLSCLGSVSGKDVTACLHDLKFIGNGDCPMCGSSLSSSHMKEEKIFGSTRYSFSGRRQCDCCHYVYDEIVNK